VMAVFTFVLVVFFMLVVVVLFGARAFSSFLFSTVPAGAARWST